MRGGGALRGQARQCTGSGSACGACQWTVVCVVMWNKCKTTRHLVEDIRLLYYFYILYLGCQILWCTICKYMHDVSLLVSAIVKPITHLSDGEVSDFIVCKTSVSVGDHRESSSSIIRLVKVIIPVLLTFLLF